MIKVLFVCLGNICRSPMAEAVFQQKVQDAGLADTIKTDSAGTSGWHAGETAHRGTLQVLKNHNIPYDGRSRQVKSSDFNQFNYIVAMDRSNLENLKRMAQGTDAEIALFLSYANKQNLVSNQEVPDPYYDNRFDHVYELIEQGANALLAKIREDHNL